MKKFVSTLLLLIVFLTACGSSVPQADGYSFIDDLGRSVTVSNPQRVACLLGSYADIWMLAGGQVCAAADDAFEDLCLDMPKDAVNLGSTHSPSKEELLASSPDLVLASSKLSAHLEMQESLEACGIAVAYFDVPDLEGYLNMLKICSEILQAPENFEKYGSDIEERINEILARNKDKEAQKVLVLRASASSVRVKASDGTMLGGMLSDFGCINIADSNSSLLENLSLEAIVDAQPDRIFFVETGNDPKEIREYVDSLFSDDPLWQSLDCVKEGKVYFMEKELYNLKPNARFAESYEKLEKILYEE